MEDFGLYPYQTEAMARLKTGSILCGGVGSGKSRTALAYYLSEYGTGTKALYIITTPRKRDGFEWENELLQFKLFRGEDPTIVIDSWNKIGSYENIENGFFIFDEQRVVGNGAWVKSFLKIAKKNDWILLTATPGDKWMDYIPVFVANGFYKNRTEFIRQHVVFKSYSKYPIVERYLDVKWLIGLKNAILVNMDYESAHEYHWEFRDIPYNKQLERRIEVDRWDIFQNAPVKTAATLCYTARRCVNTHPARLSEVRRILQTHPKAIIFYNFDYELELLHKLENRYNLSEWNGHNHDPLPDGDRWAYLVQYSAGCEAWNCTTTDTIIFYSLNYSYRVTKQASGRIDRLNSPYKVLNYYFLKSQAKIDNAILNALKNKKDFNENDYYSQKKHGL